MPTKRQPKTAPTPEPEPSFVSVGYQPYNEMPPPPPARNPHWLVIRAESREVVHYYTSEEAARAKVAALRAPQPYGFREEYGIVPLGLPD